MIKLKELKHFRIDQNLKIIDLAKSSGLHRDKITRIENGNSSASIESLERLADCLGFDITFTPKNKI